MRKQENGNRLPIEIEILPAQEVIIEGGGTAWIDAGTPPTYAHEGDAGLDCYSPVDVVILPHIRFTIPLRFKIAIPEGYVGIFAPRSGIACKKGIQIANTPGVIDSTYRGEVLATLINTDDHEPFEVRKGDKIVQLLIMPVMKVEWVPRNSLDNTDRGEGGYGSTGR